jgi:hypothetical protein
MADAAMSSLGYVKVWRKLEDSDLWMTDPLTLKIWLWILMHACHKEQRLANITLQPGELLTTYTEIMKAMVVPGHGFRKRYAPTLQTVRSSMQALCALYVISKQQAPQQGGLHIKVLHWEDYQGQAKGQPTPYVTDISTDLQQTSNTIQEGKECKEVKTLMSEASSDLSLFGDDDPPTSKEKPREKKQKKGLENPRSAHSIRSKPEGKLTEGERVFLYWVDRMGKSPTTMYDGPRRTKCETRLKRDSTEDELKRAVDGCASSSHHMGGNEDGRTYNDLELICRDRPKVEAFMEMAMMPRPGRSSNGNGSGKASRMARIRTAFDEIGPVGARAMCASEDEWKEVQREYGR